MCGRTAANTAVRHAVITGAGAGIGASVARRLRDGGSHITIMDVDPRSAQVAVALDGEYFQLDVADRTAWSDVAARIASSGYRVDELVLNVGGGTAAQPVDVLTVSDAAIDRALGVNIGGVLNGLRALAPVLTERAAVVVIASVRGIWPGPMDPFYSASKHALVGFVRSAAPGLAERGIRINAVCPGPTLTPATARYVHESSYYSSAPWQSPEAVADTVAKLLSSNQTGAVYRVLDGRATKLRFPQPTY